MDGDLTYSKSSIGFLNPTLVFLYWKHEITTFMCKTLGLQRYKRAVDVLYGKGFDVATRFDAKEDEQGILLLNKLFETYQD